MRLPQSFILIIFISFTLVLSACNRSTKSFFHEGVSAELAKYRSRQIYDVNYQLHFDIPEQQEEAIKGTVKVLFKPLKARHGVILDFTPGESAVHQLRVNDQQSEYFILNGHIYIDADQLIPRQQNVIEISFTASDQALNRSDDFMYTLFVPDKASTAFPCFDQPDIKARFSLSLDIPDQWTAISNGKEKETVAADNRKTMAFASGNPISTYLFAFAAGEFDVITHTQDNRSLRMFHRETDDLNLENNVSAIFDQHFTALQWLEDYTGIPYPYEKFDIALIPGFQYSGMEHPGAVWYRDSRLLIDKNPPLTQVMRKASLIAHETAHMWFGNLVTMQWFDDVWLKEVFAGFMADKILQQQFPDENHTLQFLLSHYPKAMSVDRTAGTHPIKQHLANMKMAGTLYGPIIYNKAPIVFEQLELIMKPQKFQTAVREYLMTYAHGNADWSDLVTIMDKHSEENISNWSDAWVYGSGLPHIGYSRNPQEGELTPIHIQQDVITDDKTFPAQYLGIHIVSKENKIQERIWFDEPSVQFSPSYLPDTSMAVMLNGMGMGYGFFRLLDADTKFIRQNLQNIEDESLRAAIYLNMYENFLHHTLSSEFFYTYLIHAITMEDQQLLQNYLLDNLKVWALNYPSYSSNTLLQEEVENLLWQKMLGADAKISSLYLETWLKLARTPDSGEKMRALYLGELTADNLSISEQNYTVLALEASIRDEANADLLQKETQRIKNPDRLKRFNYILPAASIHEEERDQFFERLKNPENRNPEPWVVDALYYLHHPLHANQGMQYIPHSLDMLQEIQQTGDIFFPQNWLMATLDNYSNPQVAALVNQYLDTHPDLEENLRLKVLQSSDILMRSARTQQ